MYIVDLRLEERCIWLASRCEVCAVCIDLSEFLRIDAFGPMQNSVFYGIAMYEIDLFCLFER
jgi:hypothetical protein